MKKLFKKFPDTITILLIISIVFILLTWVIPAGEYEREILNGREVVVPGSYKAVNANPQGLGAFLMAPIKGFVSAALVIGFVFLVGGAFSILNKTGAINAGLYNIIKFSKRKPQYKVLIIPAVTALFSLGGATFGMSEEILVFILITIPLSYALGYDAMVGAAIPIIGTGVGFAGAFTNPFTIGIAQGIAEVPIFSGMGYRIVVWAILTGIACIAMGLYCRKIEKDPTKSPLYDMELGHLDELKEGEIPALTNRRRYVLITLFLAIAFLIYGVNAYSWYINEIAALFVGLGMLSAIIYRMPVSEAVEAFLDGAKEMMIAAMVIGMAKGLLVIAQDGKVIDTMLYGIAVAAGNAPKVISVELMLGFQSALNFFIPSGSGQAALTMPIIAPLSDILGISRQVSVLAFQMGDGLTNMIIPTSGVTMGALSIAKIPFNKWLRWAFPIVLLLFIASGMLLLPPVFMFVW